MDQFFSLCSDGKGKIYYFDSQIRRDMLDGKLKYCCYDTDCYSSILDYFGFRERDVNKYEYNPITRRFKVNRMHPADDYLKVKMRCLELDFKTIVPELIIKPVIHPFKDMNRKRVTKKDIELLKQWELVSHPAGGLPGQIVWRSVSKLVGASVYDFVYHSVFDSVYNSVSDLVCGSIVDDRYILIDGEICAYISSFFKIEKWIDIRYEKGKNPFQPAIDLWLSGLVPSFSVESESGKIFNIMRLHGGKKGEILWEQKEKYD